MGGIIVIDFIDMNKAEFTAGLYTTTYAEVMANDRTRHNILPLSQQIRLDANPRVSVSSALDVVTAEKCPPRFGKGEVQPSLLFTDTLKEKLGTLSMIFKVNNFISTLQSLMSMPHLKKDLCRC